jgi:hypothetical protein
MSRKKPVTGLDPVMDTGFAKRSCSGEKLDPDAIGCKANAAAVSQVGRF